MRFFAIACAALLGTVFAAPTQPVQRAFNHLSIANFKFQLFRGPMREFKLLDVTLAIGPISTSCRSISDFPWSILCDNPDFKLEVDGGWFSNFFRDKWEITVYYNRFRHPTTQEAQQVRVVRTFSMREALKGMIPPDPRSQSREPVPSFSHLARDALLPWKLIYSSRYPTTFCPR